MNNKTATSYVIPDWPHVYGKPSAKGQIKAQNSHFEVEEILGFEPSGQGEHAFIYLQKEGENTDFVARQLARFAGVNARDVGYAGLKDRHALTRQWFSIWLPGQPDPDWHAFTGDQVKVLKAARHNKKLKRGVHKGNRFKIIVSQLTGNLDDLPERLHKIAQSGIANYFGEQRFGSNGQNVSKAQAMFLGQKVKRQQRSLYLSAVRSFLFNHVLARRVEDASWNKAIPGDTFIFDGSQQYFKTQVVELDIQERLENLAIHPGGTLFGSGSPINSDEALALELQLGSKFPGLYDGLKNAKVEMALRPLRANVEDLHWQFTDTGQLQLSFGLTTGSYATSLIRELIATQTLE